MSDDTPILVAEGLTRLYGETTGVEGLDLQVHAGEVLGLIGPNGGGKTTLLLLMAGLVVPGSGSVMVEGTSAHLLARQGAGKVGLITADHGLYPILSGWENLAFFGGLFGLREAQVHERADPLLERLGMTGDLERRVATYSSGMKQKLSLCRALLMDPVLLLLDEPTANLDPVSALHIYALLRERADRGLAVVWATHDLHAAEHVCDRVVSLNRRLGRARSLEGERSVPRPGLLELYGE